MDSLLIVAIVVLIFLLFVEACPERLEGLLPSRREKICVKTPHGGECYEVCKEFEKKPEAAKLLSHLNNMNVEFMRHVRSTQGKMPATMQRRVEALRERYNPSVMKENTPHNSDSPRSTSYTTNKGERMMVCLRSLETDEFDGVHTLEFVVLHELAHVLTDIWGHDTPFWVNFKWVLQQAKIAGIHEPVDYKKHPVRYCGMDIDYNPYFDNTLQNLG